MNVVIANNAVSRTSVIDITDTIIPQIPISLLMQELLLESRGVYIIISYSVVCLFVLPHFCMKFIYFYRNYLNYLVLQRQINYDEKSLPDPCRNQVRNI